MAVTPQLALQPGCLPDVATVDDLGRVRSDRHACEQGGSG